MAPIRIGIVGGGRIGKVHIESIVRFVPEAEIRCLADPLMNDNLQAWAIAQGVLSCVDDPEIVFSDPQIDAVLVCSPTPTHASFVQRAAECGKHVFCEKPLDTDLKRIDETLRVVEQAGVKFQIGFNRRFDHNFSALQKIVADGGIGDVQLLKITSRDPSPPPAEYVRNSGGIFMDMMIHDIDMARFLTGLEVVEVYAKGAVLIDPAIGDAGDVDTAVLQLTFSNGALGVIDNSRKACYGYDQRAEVFGSKGSAQIENDAPSTVRVSSAGGVVCEKPLHFFLERYLNAYSREIIEFLGAVKEDKPVPCGPMDARKSVQIALAATQSLHEGRPVRIM